MSTSCLSREEILTYLSFEERGVTFFNPQVLEKSVSMMESFQGGEEVSLVYEYQIHQNAGGERKADLKTTLNDRM